MNRRTRLILLGLLICVAGFDLGILVGPSLLRSRREPILLTGIPDVHQSTTYSCGAAALQGVMSYYGMDRRERVLMEWLKTNKRDGTSPENILRVAEENGFQARIREGLTPDDLELAVRQGIPVIADIQAWADRSGAEFSWAGAWEDGHYVIVIGVDDGNIYVEDPSLLGTRGVIPKGEFIERWHDYEGTPPHDASDRSYVRMGIFITGKSPSPQPVYTKVD